MGEGMSKGGRGRGDAREEEMSKEKWPTQGRKRNPTQPDVPPNSYDPHGDVAPFPYRSSLPTSISAFSFPPLSPPLAQPHHTIFRYLLHPPPQTATYFELHLPTLPWAPSMLLHLHNNSTRELQSFPTLCTPFLCWPPSKLGYTLFATYVRTD